MEKINFDMVNLSPTGAPCGLSIADVRRIVLGIRGFLGT